jgi:phosphohistidine phosphatase
VKLILFRHGVAMDREEAAAKKIADQDRPLIPKGKEKLSVMVKWLKKNQAEIDLIVTSPYKRAQQTTEEILKAYKIKSAAVCAEVTPEDPPQAFAEWLQQYAKNSETVCLVGHEPHLSRLASWALSGQIESFIEFKKSGILCLELNDFKSLGPRTCYLKWLVSPKTI